MFLLPFIIALVVLWVLARKSRRGKARGLGATAGKIPTLPVAVSYYCSSTSLCKKRPLGATLIANSRSTWERMPPGSFQKRQIAFSGERLQAELFLGNDEARLLTEIPPAMLSAEVGAVLLEVGCYASAGVALTANWTVFSSEAKLDDALANVLPLELALRNPPC